LTNNITQTGAGDCERKIRKKPEEDSRVKKCTTSTEDTIAEHINIMIRYH
jgi:hypothetical protein